MSAFCRIEAGIAARGLLRFHLLESFTIVNREYKGTCSLSEVDRLIFMHSLQQVHRGRLLNGAAFVRLAFHTALTAKKAIKQKDVGTRCVLNTVQVAGRLQLWHEQRKSQFQVWSRRLRDIKRPSFSNLKQQVSYQTVIVCNYDRSCWS